MSQPVLRAPTLSQRISDALLRDIVRGAIQPGETMPSEEVLAGQFDVSRPVIREAVKELVVLGLVESRQGRLSRVAAESEWNSFDPRILLVRSEIGAVDTSLLELLELRRLVEAGAAGLAAARRSAHDLAAMEKALEAMDGGVADAELFLDHDIEFHSAVLHATGNPMLIRLIDLIAPLLRVGRRISLQRRPDGAAESQEGHRRIFAAISDGDAERARRAMREHLLWTADLRLDDDEAAGRSTEAPSPPN